MRKAKSSQNSIDSSLINKALEVASIGIFNYFLKEDKFILSEQAIKILGYEEKEFYTPSDVRSRLLTEDKILFDSFHKNIEDIVTRKHLNIKFHKPIDKETTEIISLNIKTKPQIINHEFISIYGVIQDITNQKRQEKDLIKAKDKAIESEKLKTAFIANMSHEIRTPMNAIIGFSELLNIGTPSVEKRQEWSRIIKIKSKFLLTLVDDIMEIAKLESGEIRITKSECNLNNLITECQLVFDQVKIDKGKEYLNIKINIPPVSVNTFTDGGRITQVLNNLMNNAIKYTDKGEIELGYFLNQEQKIQFYVKDSGIGMDTEESKNIFDRFSTVEETIARRYSESGLGLLISKSLIKLLGGKIWVESEIGKGSTFYFTIPAEAIPDDGAIKEKNHSFSLNNYNWKDKLILVVEDEEVNYIFLESLLLETQAQIIHAKNGYQAIDLIKSMGDKIDLILMDIKMPEMDGYQTTREIRKIKPKIPIIAQTAFARSSDQQKCIDAGCNDYVSKPIEIEDLVTKVDNIFIELS